MKIYTKKGDKGETRLLYGDAVSKDNERVKERYMENFAIFFMPSLLIVGSTRNQWPIIMDENTADINKIGMRFLILLIPMTFNEETVKDTKASAK